MSAVLVIGLTGGVATGKSTVASYLQELGAIVLDADVYAREAVRPGEPALEEIRRAFGDEVILPDGSLDRARLARIVFSDERRRKELEAIVHPRVRSRMAAELADWRKRGTARVVVCDIPLLFETGIGREAFHRILVVFAPREVQKQRLMRRNGLSAEEAEMRIRAQIPTEEKVKQADDVVDNSGDLADTYRQVERIWKEWQRLCASPS